jgi:ribonucleoside-triphosphate reductase
MTNNKLGKGVKFQRIRRITGYLTGDLRTWCDAKKAEEKDRVKHSLGGKKNAK